MKFDEYIMQKPFRKFFRKLGEFGLKYVEINQICRSTYWTNFQKNFEKFLSTQKTLKTEILRIKFQVFERIRAEGDGEKLLSKIVCVAGDVTEPNLGLSDHDQATLMKEVTVVFHSAATVKFNESLETAVTLNTIGTQRVLLLCRKMKQLKVTRLSCEKKFSITDKFSVVSQWRLTDFFWKGGSSSDFFPTTSLNIPPSMKPLTFVNKGSKLWEYATQAPPQKAKKKIKIFDRWHRGR